MDFFPLIFDHYFLRYKLLIFVSMNGGILIKSILTLPWLRSVSILMNDSTDTEAQVWAVAHQSCVCRAGGQHEFGLGQAGVVLLMAELGQALQAVGCCVLPAMQVTT